MFHLDPTVSLQVREAEKRVRDLEEEKHKLDDELKTHVERTRRVNIGQEVTFLLLVFLLLQLMALILILWSLLWVLGHFKTFMRRRRSIVMAMESFSDQFEAVIHPSLHILL